MVRKPIVWTNTSKIEKRKILQFWVDHNKNSDYSISLNKEINDILDSVSIFHYLGKPTNFEKIRVIIVRNFSIFYKITDDEILVVGIWDNRQNPEKLIIDF